MRRRGAGAAFAALLVVFSLAAACGRARDASSPPAGPVAETPSADGGSASKAIHAEPEALATVTAGNLTVAVLRVQRLSAALLQVDLSVTNAGQAPVDLAQILSSPAGRLEQSSLTHASGDARTFVVRDDHGKAQCSDDLGPLPPGGRRALFVRFAAFSASGFSATLELPGIPVFPALAVPAAVPAPAGTP